MEDWETGYSYGILGSARLGSFVASPLGYMEYTYAKTNICEGSATYTYALCKNSCGIAF